MVLILKIFIFSLLTNSVDCTTEITTAQSKTIAKHLKKQFKMSAYEAELIHPMVETGNGVFDLFKITNPENEDAIYVWLGSVFTCDLGGCTAAKKFESSSKGSSEYFELILTTNADQVISSLKITNYFSDYGYEVMAKSYTNKYVDNSVCHFSTSTDNQIDVISGATISCDALMATIQGICELNIDL